MESALSYREQLKSLPEAQAARDYLERRGISEETAQAFGLGFVSEPHSAEDLPMRGRLSIPYKVHSYVHGWSIVTIRYRALDPEQEPKYRSRKGDSTCLFNSAALNRHTDYICITEGELDCISAEQAGLPAVGLAGADRWEDWTPRLFRGFRSVYVLQDNDKAGEKLASRIAKSIANVKVIVMEDGDVNDTLVNRGEDFLRGLVNG